jgi:hypothetical protein
MSQVVNKVRKKPVQYFWFWKRIMIMGIKRKFLFAGVGIVKIFRLEENKYILVGIFFI